MAMATGWERKTLLMEYGGGAMTRLEFIIPIGIGMNQAIVQSIVFTFGDMQIIDGMILTAHKDVLDTYVRKQR